MKCQYASVEEIGRRARKSENGYIELLLEQNQGRPLDALYGAPSGVSKAASARNEQAADRHRASGKTRTESTWQELAGAKRQRS